MPYYLIPGTLELPYPLYSGSVYADHTSVKHILPPFGGRFPMQVSGKIYHRAKTFRLLLLLSL